MAFGVAKNKTLVQVWRSVSR